MSEDIRGRAAEALIALIPLYYKNVMRNRHTANGVLVAEYHTLGVLMKYKALPMSEIGSRLYISRPYMTRLADMMIADGLVERQADPTDRRVTNLAITPKGKKFLKESVSRYKKTLSRVSKALTIPTSRTWVRRLKMLTGSSQKSTRSEWPAPVYDG